MMRSKIILAFRDLILREKRGYGPPVKRRLPVLFLSGLLVVAVAHGQKTYTNPLLPSGADPWVTQHGGFYYYTQTTGNNVTLWKTRNMGALAAAEKKVVWTPPDTGALSRQIWAPEIHLLAGKWYVYVAADDGNNSNHRIYVLENGATDPLKGKWVMKGQLHLPGNKWAIDASVFENLGKMYVIWSGWKGDVNGEQDIFIARLKNPWTAEGGRTLISSPTYSWERNGDLTNPNDVPHVNVNEGPEMLEHGDQLFLTYSASGCWTDTYALGMLTAHKGSDLLNAASWTKSDHPVFRQSPENYVYATGHNSFFTSPDGTESFIVYHANAAPGEGCGRFRSPRMQLFHWNKDGTPDFGVPVATGVHLDVPSGTPGIDMRQNPVANYNFPDPTVINHNGTYYAYATNSMHDGKMVNVQVATSHDLFHWTYQGDAMPVKPKWASHTQRYWAPDALYDSASGRYVLFFSAQNDDTALNMCIGVAFSKSPTGPFTDSGKPLLAGKGFSHIDPMAFVDPRTGRKFLYWGSDFAPLKVQQLNDDWKSFKRGSVAKAVLFPDKSDRYSKLVEGSWVDYHDGKYYLYYSGDNCCGDGANYAVMVARAGDPLGPFEKLGDANGTHNSVIVAKDRNWFAPGHNSIVKDSHGQDWIVYHAIWPDEAAQARQERKDIHVRRVMCIEPLAYINGWPVVSMSY